MSAYWSAERWNDLISGICFKIFQQKVNKNRVGKRVEPTLAKILMAVKVVCWIHGGLSCCLFWYVLESLSNKKLTICH